MHYRTITDMAAAIRRMQHTIPSGIDLVVGIPRSGMLAASIIALYRNLKLVDVSGFLSNVVLSNGRTRKSFNPGLDRPQSARHVLLVDDSIDTGESIRSALNALQNSGFAGVVTSCAVFAAPSNRDRVDLHFEVVRFPRIFEWNLMHRQFLCKCCMDLDGVLCIDPSAGENDDGSNYLKFISEAPPYFIPSYPVGRIVTSRLEKYRSQTEAWLERWGVRFRALDMLNLPDAATRRAIAAHAVFKASVYTHATDTELFIESERGQAVEIANRAGKPVLSFLTQELFEPGVSVAYLRQVPYRWASRVRWLGRNAIRAIRR